MKNTLFYGDNLEVLRSRIDDESVDLCYVDPPFNSKRTYNQIYNNIGQEDRAQAQAFVDTWIWDTPASHGYHEITSNREGRFSEPTIELLKGLRNVLKEGPLLAYLVSITLRAVEIQRVLRSTGSFFLHCDPTASHYLKLILDGVFCSKGGDFKNGVIWHYRKWGVRQKQFVSNHDTILFYTKSNDPSREFKQLFMDRAPSTLKRFGNSKIISGHDASGKRLPSQMDAEESEGVPMDDVWDIGRVPPIKQLFPTQKPDSLLERIIDATTREGDVVLDAYCGCGTTVVLAERMKRSWIGIDITYQAISVILFRLEQEWGKGHIETISLDGIPKDMKSALALANKQDDRLRKEFEKWAILTYTDNAAVVRDKKGADRGVDGVAYFYATKDETAKAIFQVKSGGVKRSDVATLAGDLQRESAAIGILLTLEPPSRNMMLEAKSAGPYIHPLSGRSHDKIQIVTVEDIIESGKRLELPLNIEVLRAAQRGKSAKQMELKLRPAVSAVKDEILKKQVQPARDNKRAVKSRTV
ncbi:MAG: methyltransferase [Acidobacteriales bacterium]|nr:methyltransferase [Terriglobales bacterium]